MQRFRSSFNNLTSSSYKLLSKFNSLCIFSSCYCFSYSPNTKERFYDHLLKSTDSLASTKQIHSLLTFTGLILDTPHLSSQIILKYAKFNEPIKARLLFDSINSENSCSFLYNTMIRAYANGGHCFETLELYSVMCRAGVSPNNFTFPFVIKACSTGSLISQGEVCHGDAIKTGFYLEFYVGEALMDMYVKFGCLCDAMKVFDEMPVKDLVCWTKVITAYEQAEKPEEAINLFKEMEKTGDFADSVTIVSLASAIGQLGDDRMGRSVHAYAIRNRFLEKSYVGNSIIGMYTKCGSMERVRLVFETMDDHDIISWNSMLSGYTQNGQASEALKMFDEMMDSGIDPSPVTALIMITACAYLGFRTLGRKFHDFIINSEMKIDTYLMNALIDMYAKCGDLDTALKMFNDMLSSQRTVDTWNILISGFGVHGRGKQALQFFIQMQAEGVEPNHITFTSILSACSHTGLVDEGRKCFADMGKLSVKPEVKHYACMVDMLGRTGRLQEAFDLIKEMPLPPNDDVWGALLLACKIHGNLELGEIAANNLFQLEPDRTGYYVLMSNIYAASNKWQEVGKLRQQMKERGLKKPTAFSVVEYGIETLGFHSADQVSPYRQEVYIKVENLATEMKMAGYVPNLSCVLQDVEEEDKEHILNYHSEKLVIAFGILKIEPESPIRITNNLRVCNDCHSILKFISGVYRRRIIVRDVNRFHHFEGGSCSCNDYW